MICIVTCYNLIKMRFVDRRDFVDKKVDVLRHKSRHYPVIPGLFRT